MRICAYCATANADALRYCTRCAAGLDRAPYRPRPAAPVPVVEPAHSSARPVPRSERTTDRGAAVLVPALPVGPIFVVCAAAAPSPVPRQGSWAQRPAPAREPLALAQVLGWLGGGVLLSVALLLASQQGLRHLPDWPRALAWPSSNDPPPEAVDAPPEPAARPAPDARALAAAINAELRRLGVGSVRVSVTDGGATTVTGRLTSQEDHDELLLWLQSVPGVGDIDDRIQLEHAPVAVQPPAPPPPAVRPTIPAAPAQAQAPPTRPVKSAARLAQPPSAAPAGVERPAGWQPAPVAPPAIARPEPPAAPDADTIARTVRRELLRLALTDVTAEVDPSSLQITLRGRTNDGARKAQALAAARAANPGGRVRDLVFLIEE